MISQLDPMIAISKGEYYEEEKVKIDLMKKKDEIRNEKYLKGKDSLNSNN